jgi:hypothetical protein
MATDDTRPIRLMRADDTLDVDPGQICLEQERGCCATENWVRRRVIRLESMLRIGRESASS